MKAVLIILLLTLFLLATTFSEPVELNADDCPDQDHCQTQITLIWLPIISGGPQASSAPVQPTATATPLAPPAK